MKKLSMVILLSCSTNLGAAEKADFTLHWQAEQRQPTYLKQRLWEEQKKSSQFFSSDTSEQKSRLPDMFDRVDKAHRQRFKDPNFSSFNSDDGY